MSLFARSKVTAQNNRVEVKGPEWTLWISRQNTRDGQTLFLIKTVRVRYIQASQTFIHDDLVQPIWLTPSEYASFVRSVQQLAEEAEAT